MGLVVSRGGQEAGVKVSTDSTTGRIQCASLHDLRFIWEAMVLRVLPQTLKDRYYVGQNVKRTAKARWEAVNGEVQIGGQAEWRR